MLLPAAATRKRHVAPGDIASSAFRRLPQLPAGVASAPPLLPASASAMYSATVNETKGSIAAGSAGRPPCATVRRHRPVRPTVGECRTRAEEAAMSQARLDVDCGRARAAGRALPRVTAALVMGALLAMPSCARSKKREGGGTTAESTVWRGSVPVIVTNRYALDVVVFAIVSGQRQRLGLVTAATRQTFTFPLSRLVGGQPLRLRAEPVGRRSERELVTEAIVVQPGQRVEWMIESGLERSTVGVY